MGYPAQCDLNALFAEYYNAVPEGLCDDRWGQRDKGSLTLAEYTRQEVAKGDIIAVHSDYGDYTSPEYDTKFHLKAKKWELTRGIGMSYGYNRNEDPDNFMTGKDIVCTLADVCSKNGNLLLNVGPMADGTIEPAQRQALLDAGAWLKTNGEAIYGTTYCPTTQETVTDKGCRVSFTRKGDAVYAIVQDDEPCGEVRLADYQIPAGAKVSVIGAGDAAFSPFDGGTRVRLPDIMPEQCAYVIRIDK